MAVRLLENDLMDPELMAMIKGGGETLHEAPKSKGMAGTMKIEGCFFPGIVVLDVKWDTPSHRLHIRDNQPSQNINIQFQLAGALTTQFDALKHRLDMTPGKHNLICVPERGDQCIIAPDTKLEMLHISIDRTYFSTLIGSDNGWAENIQRELEFFRPFSAIHGTANTSPSMMRLISEIRTSSNEPKSLQLLKRQARVIDLLSMQLAQYIEAANGKTNTNISSRDLEQLSRLKEYLNTHFLDSDLSLYGLAQLFQLNQFKLKAGFKAHFQTTVFGYIRELRLKHACKLLEEGCSAEETAFALGYEHPQHFTAAFKKSLGLPPKIWVNSRARDRF